jgi:hypothetical protein
MNTSTKQGLNVLQPSNLLVLMVFYSPIIVALSILSWTFVMQSVKGFVYLGFLLAMCVLREFLYYISGNMEGQSSNPVCHALSFSKLGNNTFSAFMLAFTIVYISMPMFINKSVNWMFLGAAISLFVTDIGVRKILGCSPNISTIFLNISMGITLAVGIVGAMVSNGGEKFLFFNEIQSNKVICSRPKKQQFKCAVYKNGELISDNVVD